MLPSPVSPLPKALGFIIENRLIPLQALQQRAKFVPAFRRMVASFLATASSRAMPSRRSVERLHSPTRKSWLKHDHGIRCVIQNRSVMLVGMPDFETAAAALPRKPGRNSPYQLEVSLVDRA